MINKSPKYIGKFPFSEPKWLNQRIGTTIGLNDFKLTVFRFFTFLVRLKLISKKHING